MSCLTASACCVVTLLRMADSPLSLPISAAFSACRSLPAYASANSPPRPLRSAYKAASSKPGSVESSHELPHGRKLLLPKLPLCAKGSEEA